MNPHADRDHSEEPRPPQGCRCTVPCNTVHDCAQTPQAVFVELSTDDLLFPGRWITYADLAEKDATIAELIAKVGELQRWKSEALPVISGLQDVGHALGLPLGASITGEMARDAALDLRNRAEKSEAALARAIRAHRDLHRAYGSTAGCGGGVGGQMVTVECGVVCQSPAHDADRAEWDAVEAEAIKALRGES